MDDCLKSHHTCTKNSPCRLVKASEQPGLWDRLIKWNEFGKEHKIQWLTTIQSYLSIALMDDEIVGYVFGGVGMVYPNLFYIYYLYVGELYRHRGIGSFVLRQVEEAARSHGCSTVLLSADLDDPIIHSFYLKNRYFPEHEDVCRWYQDRRPNLSWQFLRKTIQQ